MSRSKANWAYVTLMMLLLLIYVRPRLTGGCESTDEWVDVFGVMISAVGLLIRAVARDCKLRNCPTGLVMTGPYSVVRNPMYVGSFLMGLGLCVIVDDMLFSAAFVVGFTAIHALVVRSEERFLMSKWPDEYLGYKATVPACVPRLSGLVRAVTRLPRLSKAAISREMNAICGVALGAILFEAREDYVAVGWAKEHFELSVLLGLALVVLIVWLVFTVGPAKTRAISA